MVRILKMQILTGEAHDCGHVSRGGKVRNDRCGSDRYAPAIRSGDNRNFVTSGRPVPDLCRINLFHTEFAHRLVTLPAG